MSPLNFTEPNTILLRCLLLDQLTAIFSKPKMHTLLCVFWLQYVDSTEARFNYF